MTTCNTLPALTEQQSIRVQSSPPNKLVFGEDVTHPVELVYGLRGRDKLGPSPHVFISDLKEKLEEVWTVAREALGQAADVQQQTTLAKKKNIKTYQEGELVYKWHPPASVGKLGPKWVGPYKIIKVIDPWVVVLHDGKKEITANTRNIKPKLAEK